MTRNRKRTRSDGILIIGVLTIVLAAVGVAPFLRIPALRREHQREALQLEVDARANKLRWTIIRNAEAGVERLACWPSFLDLLRNPGSDALLADGRRLLGAMAAGLGAGQLYLTDDRGRVLAVGQGSPRTLEGQNQAFRPYFREAMMGRASVYPALGLASGRRGLYVSAPVRALPDDDVEGVLVAVLGVEPIETLLASCDHLLLLVSPEGIVLAGNDPRWRYRAVTPLTADTRFRIEAERQFGDILIEAGPAELSGENAVIDGQNSHVMSSGGLMHGWRLLSCAPVDSSYGLPSQVWLLLAVVGTSILILVLEVVLLTVNVVRRRRVEARHTMVIKNCAEALLIVEQERIRYFNPQLCLLTGYSRDELVSMNAFDLFHPGDRAAALSHFEECVAGGVAPRQDEVRLRTQGLETRWVLLSAVRVQWEGRDAFLAFLVDVTQRNRLLERLYHTERMEAIGQLAGGVAHDFNNLLVGILGHTGVLKHELRSDESQCHRLETIEQSAHRAAELTQQLLGFARRGRHRSVPIDVHQLILDTVHFLSRTVGRTVEMIPELTADRHVVMGDPSQIKQVFVNLTINARDAMPDGGKVYIETRDTRLSRTDGDHAGEVEAEAVEIIVRDTGHGIGAGDVGRVFEPFFTTKDSSKGTGMGLAMVYGIVMNHGGTIRVESPLDEGARFEIVLPVTDREPVDLTAITPAPPTRPIPENLEILTIDDDPTVLEAGVLILERLGYTAEGFTSVRDAVDHYRHYWHEIDVAIIDMEMPGMDGGACFRELKAIHPGIRAILTTGYGLDGKAQELLDEGMSGFLQKPYTLDEIRGAIERALQRDDE